MSPKLILPALLLLPAWIVIDLAWPVKTDLHRFDPTEVGRLDAAMWRSYYERRPVRLYFQLSRLLRRQYRAPFWRSLSMAYSAGKAAFVFKNGRGRAEYAAALPYLERFYRAVNRLSRTPFPARRVAEIELEWWIIRREAHRHTFRDWERLLAEEAGLMYHLPPPAFAAYAEQRAAAMRRRDRLQDNISDSDWQTIEDQLVNCWTALHRAVNAPAT